MPAQLVQVHACHTSQALGREGRAAGIKYTKALLKVYRGAVQCTQHNTRWRGKGCDRVGRELCCALSLAYLVHIINAPANAAWLPQQVANSGGHHGWAPRVQEGSNMVLGARHGTQKM